MDTAGQHSGPQTGSVSVVLALIAVFFLWSPQAAEAIRSPSANRECSICHIMWLTAFKRKDVTTLVPYEPRPVVETGKQDVSSTERMCLSCHDGFVLDSRFLWKTGTHGHPVGKKPSKNIRIPMFNGKEVFPLNDDGKVYCGTCHTAHGVEWEQKESPVFMRMKNVASSICLACHENRGTGPKKGNHPVMKTLDRFPTVLFRAGAKFSKNGQVICESCHRPHGAEGRKMLVLANKSARLCRACHEDQQSIIRTKHDLSLMAPKSRNSKGLAPGESGPCGACHVAHGGSGPALWARAIPAGMDLRVARCVGCHNPKGIAKKKTVGDHSHPVNLPIARLGIKATAKAWSTDLPLLGQPSPLVPLPLYNGDGLKARKGGRIGCGTCHDPHRWSPDPSAARAKDPRKIEGGPGDSFLRIAHDTRGTLCANCHLDKRPVLTTKHNMTRSVPAAKNEQGRTAAQSGVCGACHKVHNGKDIFMWARGKGPAKGVIAPLCTECHRSKGSADKKLTGTHTHPVDVRLARGMRTDLPLFDGRGRSKPGKGKVDCATCHDPHLWQPGVQGGKATTEEDGDARNSFLRLVAAGDAPLCTDCHEHEGLVRGTDHDLAVTAPRARNKSGQTVAESGVCGQCHAVHNAETGVRLWARPPGAAPDRMEGLCRSCHVKNGVARAKVPPESRHPGEVSIWSSAVRAGFRPSPGADILVYDKGGQRRRTGVLTCTSCHDPHQWSARARVAGPGKNTEGDIGNSFLRISNSESFVCADCHGLDGLFRYKYYHGTTSHKRYYLYR